jgi:hypothetical protein
MRKIIPFFISFLLFVGCDTQKKLQEKETADETAALNSWLNHPKSELIRSWGAPTRVVSDGQGGEVLVYESERKMANVVYNTYLEKTITYYKEMFVNKDGLIYYGRSGRR